MCNEIKLLKELLQAKICEVAKTSELALKEYRNYVTPDGLQSPYSWFDNGSDKTGDQKALWVIQNDSQRYAYESILRILENLEV